VAGPSEGLKKMEGVEVVVQDLVKGKVFLLFLSKSGVRDWTAGSDGSVIKQKIPDISHCGGFNLYSHHVHPIHLSNSLTKWN